MDKQNNPNSYKKISENPVTIDLSGCKYLGEVHEVLKTSLGLPDYYGNNWDALWDLLRDFRWYPITIEVHGVYFLPTEMNEEIEKMLRIFNDVHQDTPFIRFEIIS